MSDHKWVNLAIRRKSLKWKKVTVHECSVCEIQIGIPDNWSIADALASPDKAFDAPRYPKKSAAIELDCDLVIIRQVMGD